MLKRKERKKHENKWLKPREYEDVQDKQAKEDLAVNCSTSRTQGGS